MKDEFYNNIDKVWEDFTKQVIANIHANRDSINEEQLKRYSDRMVHIIMTGEDLKENQYMVNTITFTKTISDRKKD